MASVNKTERCSDLTLTLRYNKQCEYTIDLQRCRLAKPLMSFELERYWIFGGQAPQRLRRLVRYEHLPPAEQVLWLLLAGSPSMADRVTTTRLTAAQQDALISLINRERLGGYILRGLDDSTLLQRLGQLVNGDFENALRRQVYAELGYWERTIGVFASVHKILDGTLSHVVWLKGPGLAATVYPEAHLRQFNDLDIMVLPPAAEDVEEALLKAGFYSDLSARIQTRAAPSGNVREVCLQPSAHYACADALVFRKPPNAFVELKLDPLDRGLRMRQVDRLLENSAEVKLAGLTIACPGLQDQLLIACCHFRKDLFYGYRTLLDVHLLVQKLNSIGTDWDEFAKLVEEEGLSDSVWATLGLAIDRLGTPVSQALVNRLRPRMPGAHLFTYTQSYMFLWNFNSLPALLAQTLLCEDRQRKREALSQALFPNFEFLRAYYAPGLPPNFMTWWLCMILHWFVLLMPSAVIKRTVGLCLWKTSNAPLAVRAIPKNK